MKLRPARHPSSSEQTIRDIKRKTREQYGAEEKIRIVLDGLRGKESIVELCQQEGIAERDWHRNRARMMTDRAWVRPVTLEQLATLCLFTLLNVGHSACLVWRRYRLAGGNPMGRTAHSLRRNPYAGMGENL